MSNSNPIQYYVINGIQNTTYVFDEDWNYVSEKTSLFHPNYMITIDNYFYITGLNSIWKTDQQLNVLLVFDGYNPTGQAPWYNGLCYNSTKSLIYVASFTLQVIHVFNLNLTINYNITTSQYQPWSINENNNQLYVGTRSGLMLVIVNKYIIKLFNACNDPNQLTYFMIFDEYDNMATSCSSGNLYLYHTNGTYLNKTISKVINSTPLFIGFDSKSRLVLIFYQSQIVLYY
jgi:hypothetical protein